MKTATQLRTVGDIRTTISTHARSTPRQKGSTFLEVYLLDKERQRLETELATLTKRQRRIENRLSEIRDAMEKLMDKPAAEPLPGPAAPVPKGGRMPGSGLEAKQWPRMAIEY